jgi:hypothetical protein
MANALIDRRRETTATENFAHERMQRLTETMEGKWVVLEI